MSTISTSVTIDAAPQDVRAVLSDLTATRSWLPGVVDARMDGDIRICRMADGQEVHERILEVSDGRLRFEHLRVALPVRRSSGTFSVAPAGEGRSVVVLELSFEPLDEALTDQLSAGIRDAFTQSLQSLRTYVEEATTWDAR
jgi:uncharacterized protein YndB with AHSA1/START domain